mgnify:CR=1 FL=1
MNPALKYTSPIHHNTLESNSIVSTSLYTYFDQFTPRESASLSPFRPVHTASIRQFVPISTSLYRENPPVCTYFDQFTQRESASSNLIIRMSLHIKRFQSKCCILNPLPPNKDQYYNATNVLSWKKLNNISWSFRILSTRQKERPRLSHKMIAQRDYTRTSCSKAYISKQSIE